jgi:alkylation response protein AidB-like acyl-CoA dehydrogenase
MELTFTEEQDLFRQSIAEFVKKDVMPKADEQDESGEFPWDWFRKAGELGCFGVRYPEEAGGSGAGFTSYCILSEEIARGSMALGLIVAMQCMMGTDFVYRFGTKDHKERLLKPALRGEKLGAFALTEPGAGSDLGNIRTTVKRDGDSYVLNGTKLWITSSTVADFFTVLATRDRDLGVKGVDFYLVEKGTPGLSLGRDIKKLGTRGSPCGEVILEDCRIPAENLLGSEQGTGVRNLQEILAQIRVMTGALGLGLCRAAYDAALQYSREREAFGRPIGKFQAIRHKLADMGMDIHASHLLVYDTAAKIDKGERPMKESAMAKLFATEAANRCADEATRIYASYGFAMEYPIQRYYRDARFLLLGGGTSELLRNIIAADIWGK